MQVEQLSDIQIKMVSHLTDTNESVLRDLIERYTKHIQEGGHIKGIDFDLEFHGLKHPQWEPQYEAVHSRGKTSHEAYYNAVRAVPDEDWAALLPDGDLMGTSLMDRAPLGSFATHVVSIKRLR